MCVCTCACAGEPVHVDMQCVLCICVEVRGQVRRQFLRLCPGYSYPDLCWYHPVPHWPGTCQVGWPGWLASPWDLPVSISTVLGLQVYRNLYFLIKKCYEYWAQVLKLTRQTLHCLNCPFSPLSLIVALYCHCVSCFIVENILLYSPSIFLGGGSHCVSLDGTELAM